MEDDGFLRGYWDNNLIIWNFKLWFRFGYRDVENKPMKKNIKKYYH